MVLSDMHTHSDNSFDASNSVIELCESAVAARLSHIAVTDHCDMDRYETEQCELALRQSYFDTLKARAVFKGQIDVLAGVELGNPLYDTGKSSSVAARYPYDIVLCSLHSIRGHDDFAFIDYSKQPPRPLLEQYFKELAEMTAWGGFDVLAHLTYPLRYINGVHKCGVSLDDYKDSLETILKMAVENNKGIEINTSGLRQPYGKTMPDLECLKLYRSLGGEIITTGSDAHSAAEVGANIVDALKLAREAGFKYYCVFKKRSAVFIRIEA